MSALPIWRVQLLGGLTARREGHRPLRFQPRKMGSMLAYLSLYSDRTHTREEIIGRIWAGASPMKGRHCLCQAICVLRRLLEPGDVPHGSVLSTSYSELHISPAAVSTDVADFLVARQSAASTRGAAEQTRVLQRAAALYTGEFMPGCSDDWALVEREKLSRAYAAVLRQLIRNLEAVGELERALEYALKSIPATPDYEDAYADVIRLYAKLGRYGDARRKYRTLKSRLERELGRKPREEIRSLIWHLRMGPTGVAEASLPPAKPQAPVPPAGDTPGPDVTQPAVVRRVRGTALPVHLTRMFGRESEIIRLAGMLRPNPDRRHLGRRAPSDFRLVTLVGPAGSGKTRLALAVAERLLPAFGGAVHFVSIPDTVDAQGLPDVILDALGVERSPDTSPLNGVMTALGKRRCLLVLDNFEHLVETGTHVIWALLQRVPTVTIMVTSQRVLELEGETDVPIRPLPVPVKMGTPERLMEFGSVQMFVDRAQVVAPDFRLSPTNARAVVAVCRRLEGLPLAIELAAARAAVLTPNQMLNELNQRFDFLTTRRRNVETRHRTMLAAVDWSYRLLPPKLQRFFRMLSVFRGGWTLEAAEAVCSDSCAVDNLQDLQRRSMVASVETDLGMRFSMLETLRDFGADQLSEQEKQEVSDSHLRFYQGLAEASRGPLQGAKARETTGLLESEHDNLRAALAHAVECGEGVTLAGALWQFWFDRGYAAEGRKWLQRALAAAGPQRDSFRARALNGLGVILQHQGEAQEAARNLEESLAIYREVGDRLGAAEVLSNLCVLVDDQGDHASARAFGEESFAAYRDLGDQWGVAAALNNLGRASQNTGDLDQAAAQYRESQALYQKLGDSYKAAVALSNLGACAAERGDLNEARGAFELSNTLFQEVGDRWRSAIALNNLGDVFYRQGDLAAARSYFRDSLTAMRELDDKARTAIPIAGLANVASSEGDHVRATRLFAAAEMTAEEFGQLLSKGEIAARQADVANVRKALSEYDFEAAWSFGRAMSLERAVSYALIDRPVTPRPTAAINVRPSSRP